MKKMSDYSNTNAATTDNPYGTFKDESSTGAGDGTDIKAPHMTDPYYALYQVLQLAGEVPNGELENGNASKQWITALQNVGIFKYDSAVTYKKNSIVINTNSDITKFYRSKVASNTYAITNTDYWYNFLTITANNTIEIDVDVPDKVDTDGNNADFGNLSSIAKDNISDLGDIDFASGISISSGFVATSGGLVVISAGQKTGSDYAYINGVCIWHWWQYEAVYEHIVSHRIAKGQTVTYSGFSNAAFYPTKSTY